LLAVHILALKYPKLNTKLIEWRKNMKEKFLFDNAKQVVL
jgi:5-(carboxyamino)imidazole ribonucleotide mutase